MRLIDADKWAVYYSEERNRTPTTNDYDAGQNDALDRVDAWMEEQPTVYPAKAALSRWIPVTERLPEYEKSVLILCKNGAMFTGYAGLYYGNEVRWKINTALSSTKLLNKGRVTHWMPLPERP